MLNLFGKKRRVKSAANRQSGGGLFHAIRAHFASAESASKDNDWWKADYLSADVKEDHALTVVEKIASQDSMRRASWARQWAGSTASQLMWTIRTPGQALRAAASASFVT